MELNKILLVEDDIAFNFLNKLFFKQNHIDCKIDVALNGEQALDYIRASEDCPEVIFLDINMPVMDGLTFLGKYDKQGKCCSHTQVYMLTSSTSEEDKAKSLSYPFVKAFFSKPLTETTINQVLETVKTA